MVAIAEILAAYARPSPDGRVAPITQLLAPNAGCLSNDELDAIAEVLPFIAGALSHGDRCSITTKIPVTRVRPDRNLDPLTGGLSVTGGVRDFCINQGANPPT